MAGEADRCSLLSPTEATELEAFEDTIFGLVHEDPGELDRRKLAPAVDGRLLWASEAEGFVLDDAHIDVDCCSLPSVPNRVDALRGLD